MKKTLSTIIITALLTCLVTNTVRDVQHSKAHGGADRKLQTIMDVVDDYSVYNTEDIAGLGDAVATAAIWSLGDEYSEYYPPDYFSSVQDMLKSSYVGIGIEFIWDYEANKVRVTGVIEGEAAEQHGVQANDYIVAVDGTRYSASEMPAFVAAIRGVEGTSVTITIEHNGVEQDITMERGAIDVETVTSNVLDGNIGYIHISQFKSKDPKVEGAKDTSDYFAEHLAGLKNQGIDSLILDLRFNGGGDFDVTNKIADILLPSCVITYTEDKNGKRQYYESDSSALDMPMVVLINEGSASGSEVIAGALRDHELATLVGEKSFGKGVVQTLISLHDGSGLRITSAKYFTPLGECIDKKGIEPDVAVSMESDKPISKLRYSEDIQLQKAVEILK